MFYYSKNIKLAENFNSSDFLEEAQKYFKQSGVSNIVLTDKEVSYKGAIFRFVWNGWNRLNGIWSVRIKIKEEELNYKLSFKEVFFISLAFSIIPASIQNTDLIILILFCIWGVVFFGNYIISVIRFNKYIKKLIKISSPEEQSYLIEEKGSLG